MVTGLPASGWIPAACLGAALALGAAPAARRAATHARQAAHEPSAEGDTGLASGPLLPTWMLAAIGTGAALLVAIRVGWSLELPAYLALVAVTAPLTAVDLAVRKLPDKLLAAAAAAAIGLLVVAAVREGTWHALGRAMLAALLLAVIFLAVAIAAGGSFGLGDVKLFAVSGLYLGYLGWRQVVTGVFATFLIAAFAGVGVAIHTRRFAGTTIALGPAILGGTLVSLLVP